MVDQAPTRATPGPAMRLVIIVLGHQLLDLTIDCGHPTEAEVEHGVPFGFSGGSICQAERAAEDWTPTED